MTLKSKMKKQQEDFLEERSFYWNRKTPHEVAKMEKISISKARMLMKKFGVEVDSNMKRRVRTRSVTWKGKTAEEIVRDLEPLLQYANVLSYAKKHNIKILKKKQGRPSKGDKKPGF